jgi:Lrp/AsnC family transcriptional regulator
MARIYPAWTSAAFRVLQFYCALQLNMPEIALSWWLFSRDIEISFRGGAMALDKIDRKILTLLQKDATMPVAEIGRKVGLSTTPCWRRIQKMEEDGVIQRRVAVLDPAKVNVGVTVFVSVKTNEHNEAWMRKFAGVIDEFPEVVEFYRMSGDVDYLMRVVVPDIGAYDAFYKRLISKINLTDVSSAFAMGQIKYTTALPLDFAIVVDDDK